jgi:hypothetical protein
VVLTLEAMAHLGLGEPTRALDAADRALAQSPNLTAALDVKAAALRMLGRAAEMAPLLEAAAKSPRATAKTLEDAGIQLLLAGSLDAARRITEEGARRGLRSARLDALARLLVKAANGPEWVGKSFEWKTSDYHIVSDIDPEICRVAGQVLQEALTQFRAQVHPVKSEPQRLYRVYLFRGQAGFQAYASETSILGGKPPENAAGQYSPLLKQLLIWNVPSRAEMLKTIKHEGFHQYLDRVLPDPPTWLNEGMAAYYEGMDKVTGTLRLDLPRKEYLDELSRNRPISLKTFVRQPEHAFYERGFASYAQGWLVVHMMRHGAPRWRELLKNLLAKLETSSASEASAALLDDDTLQAMDSELHAYWMRMLHGPAPK